MIQALSMSIAPGRSSGRSFSVSSFLLLYKRWFHIARWADSSPTSEPRPKANGFVKDTAKRESA